MSPRQIGSDRDCLEIHKKIAELVFRGLVDGQLRGIDERRQRSARNCATTPRFGANWARMENRTAFEKTDGRI
jgi:hypothetical protein